MSDYSQNLMQKRTTLAMLLNKHRLTNGWQSLPDDQAKAMVDAWVEILDNHKIPHTAYEAIYRRAMASIAKTTADGKKAPDFNVNLMASIWLGDKDLREAFAPRPVVYGGTASGGCSNCLGTGWEYMKKTYPTEVARCRCGKIPGR